MYDDEIKVPATNLPAGWSWSHFDDGSGGLYSPQGSGVASYDLNPYHQEGGIEYKIHGDWNVFWDSFDEFTEYVETTIAAELEEKNVIQPPDSRGNDSLKSIEENPEYALRPASEDEAGLFYALPPEQDEALGCIGHVRIDFGRSGKEFWHTWHPRGPEELNSPEFKKELTSVIDELRQSVLKSRSDMSNFCCKHGGQISGGWVQNHGFVIETDNYQYYLRCNPVQGDYNGYLTCFDKQVQEMNQANTQNQGMAMGGM